MDYGHVYENIVAIKRDEKIYIQVSDEIESEKTFKREIDTLLAIKDGYSKMILVRTKHDETIYRGIKIIDIARWLNH